jgi:hypothetical protein
MSKTALVGFLLSLPLPCLLFCQEPKSMTTFDGVFAYAVNTRQLVTISKDIDESNTRVLTKAICPTHDIAAEIQPAPVKKSDGVGSSGFQYDAETEVPAGNYCLLVDSKVHQRLFTWGSGDSPELLHEKKCLDATAAQSLIGRKAALCYLIGGYGTGRVELVEYAYDSPDSRLAALIVTDYPLVGGPARYSVVRFPAGSPVWATEKDGKLHPERFRHLFTISDDPDSGVWSVAIEWSGPARRDLTLYQPVGTELRPILVNHDSSHHEKQGADIASK